MKKLRTAGLVLLAVVVVARIVAAAWGRAQWGPYETAWTADLAAERARIKAQRRPPLRGEAKDENAATVSRAAIASLGKIDAAVSFSGTFAQPLATPLAGQPRKMLDEHRDAIAKLLEGTRCTRLDWDVPYETAYDAIVLDFINARRTGDLLRLDARDRLAQGDAAGAEERLAACVRYGFDLAEGSLVIQWLTGTTIATGALDDLGRLVTTAPAGAPWIDAAAKDLDALEPLAPSPVTALRTERLGVHSITNVASSGGAPGDLSRFVLPTWELYATAAVALDQLHRDAEKAVALDDRAARDVELAAIEARVTSSRNPIVAVLFPSVRGLRDVSDDVTALLRLARAAVTIEKRRDATGAYPDKADDLSLDPHSRKPLRYERTASGYKLWSVGRDGKDDGGRPMDRATRTGDLVLERTRDER